MCNFLHICDTETSHGNFFRKHFDLTRKIILTP